jgi:PAS domain S-box-containing protein
MRRITGSLVGRLVLITLLAGMVTAAIGVAAMRVIERRQFLADAERSSLARAERTAIRIDDRVKGFEAPLRVLALHPAVLGATADARRELQIALRSTDEFDEIHLYDLQGRMVAGAATARLLDPSAASVRDGLEGALPMRRIVVSDGEEPALEVAVAVEDPPGTPVGILVGRSPITFVTREASIQVPGTSEIVLVTAEDGRVLAHPDLLPVLEGAMYPLDAFAERASVVIEDDGEQVLASAAPLRSVGGWVIVERSRADVLGAGPAMLGSFALVLLAVVAAIVSAVIVLGRRLLQPLQPLGVAVDRLRSGDLATRVRPGGAGEVVMLGEGFNRMADALQEREAKREAAERKARESGMRLRLMVEGVADHAIVLLGSDGAVRSWNTGARRLLGHEDADAIGRPLTSFFASEDGPPDPLTRMRDGHARVEGWCRRGPTDRFWAEIAVTALGDDAEPPDAYAVIVHDQTDRRRAEQAVALALEQARRSADELRRTAALKDEFLAIAAHEIRTPLSAILGATHLLSGDWEDLTDEERRHYLGLIATFADDMHGIAERLLEFMRLQADRVHLNPEPIGLSELCTRQLDLLERQLEHHEVICDIEEGTVVIDHRLVQHVLGNLLSNAAKFAPPGSRITLSASTTDRTLCAAVSDEGPGVPPEDRERIFELFRQSSHPQAAARGTGVGLAIVRRYVELAGGEVELQSAEGAGSTFRVRIPLGSPADDPEMSLGVSGQ